MIQGRVDRKEGGREMERGQWGGEGGEELARARSGKERGRREGGQEGVGWGGGNRIGTMGRRLGVGNGEEKMEREQLEGGDGEGGNGKGETGGG